MSTNQSVFMKILFIHALLYFVGNSFNASICGYIEINQLYYFINDQRTDQNIQTQITNSNNQS